MEQWLCQWTTQPACQWATHTPVCHCLGGDPERRTWREPSSAGQTGSGGHPLTPRLQWAAVGKGTNQRGKYLWLETEHERKCYIVDIVRDSTMFFCGLGKGTFPQWQSGLNATTELRSYLWLQNLQLLVQHWSIKYMHGISEYWDILSETILKSVCLPRCKFLLRCQVNPVKWTICRPTGQNGPLWHMSMLLDTDLVSHIETLVHC